MNVTAFTVGEGPYATDLNTRTSENGEGENLDLYFRGTF